MTVPAHFTPCLHQLSTRGLWTSLQHKIHSWCVCGIANVTKQIQRSASWVRNNSLIFNSFLSNLRSTVSRLGKWRSIIYMLLCMLYVYFISKFWTAKSILLPFFENMQIISFQIFISNFPQFFYLFWWINLKCLLSAAIYVRDNSFFFLERLHSYCY